MKLIIVESYSKTKKIKSFLDDNYDVLACGGHIENLNSKNLSIDIIDNKFYPKYELLPLKKKFLNDIKKKNYEEILIGSDQDLEGAFIAYSLIKHLKLDIKKKNRILFSEISKEVILKSLDNKCELDMNLVYSQMCRRMIDRLLGYKFQRLLSSGYSIGRVQSSLLHLIYNNVLNHRKDLKYHYIFILDFGNYLLSEIKVQEKDFTIDFCKKIVENKIFKVIDRQNKKILDFAPKPLNTCSLQKLSSIKLKFNSKLTMSLAQSLYQKGYITYIRTTSINISKTFIYKIKNYIVDKYGKEYFKSRNEIRDNNNNSQEAHECIRITDFNNNINDLSVNEKKLYLLIFDSTLKSCMSNAMYVSDTILLSNKITQCLIEDKKLEFAGYKIIDNIKINDKKKNLNKEEYELKKINGKQNFYYNNILYNESNLINEMERKGIGRPSTFSNSINLILDKSYIELKKIIEGIEIEIKEINQIKNNFEISIKKKIIGEEKDKFIISKKGEILINYLQSTLPEVINIDYTKEMETKLDLISNNKYDYQELLKENHNYILDKLKKSNKLNDKKKSNYELLGIDENNNELFLGKSKYGYYIMKKYKKENKIQFFSYNKDDITLEEACNLTKNSYYIGNYKKKDVFYDNNYILYDKKRILVPKTTKELKLDNIKKLL